MSKAPEEQHPVKAFGWAAKDSSGLLSPFKFSRRATGDKDVRFKVLYCGICHSDLHKIKNDWGSSKYPLVPRHEIVGEVIEVGNEVKKVEVGDKVGVGCVVGACHSCENCNNDLEIYCFSDTMVANERYILRFPENLPLDASAPLLYAGITLYRPLKYYGLAEPGKHIGIVGLGGLGHVGVKFAKAFGAKVTVISTSTSKKDEALEHLGADPFLHSRDQEQIQAAQGTFDGILDTVSASHGKLVMLGAPEKPLELPIFPLLMGRKMVAGSATGGLKETQEMIDFAAKHNITADIELIPIDYLNKAMERLAKGDVRYRFVIDIGNSLASTNH
ncbi:hypothetical protein I3843_08G137200 [Carya illinoinensis]|nr:hypothetical protein I3843_08G137200 [Carya illinoinensis]